MENKETLEEAAEKIYLNYENNDLLYGHSEELQLAYKAGIVDGAKWQMERSYSEEDFKLFARQYYREIKMDKSNLLWEDLADKCLEQFKKK